MAVIPPRSQFQAGFPSSELDRPAVRTMFLSADGSRLAIGNLSATKRVIEVWDITGQPKKLSQHEGHLEALSPAGKRLIRFSDKDLAYQVIDVDSGANLGKLSPKASHVYFRSEDTVTGMNRSGDWRYAKELSVYEYEASTGKMLNSFVASDDDRVNICIVNQGRELVLGLEKANLIKVWDLPTRKLVREFSVADPQSDRSWCDFVVSSEGKWIANAWGYDSPRIFDGKTGKLVASLPERIDAYSVAFLPGRDVLVAPSNIAREEKKGNSLDFVAYDVNKREVVAAFRGHRIGGLKIAVSANGRVMATGDEEGNVLLWDLDQLK